MEKYILTGGPCTGKTTLLKRLEEEGYAIIEEVPRQIIHEELEKQKLNPDYTPIVPWLDLLKFNKLLIKRQSSLESLVEAEKVFLDRSLVDPLAYAKLGNIDLGNEIQGYIRKAAYTKAFFLEQLNLYIKDDERKESEEEGKKLHQAIYEAYRDSGIETIVVPAVSVEERLRIVLASI